jgi:hypothetical protein
MQGGDEGRGLRREGMGKRGEGRGGRYLVYTKYGQSNLGKPT